jgi:uncharacterized protein
VSTRRGQPILVHKLDAAGKEVWSYSGMVIETGPCYLVLEAFFEREDVSLQEMPLRRGDRFVETFFTDRWYNVFAVYHAGSAMLKGWYCNVARPAQIEPGSVRCADLALDLLVLPDGRMLVLDEEEFEALPLNQDEHRRALQALDELKQLAKARRGPFADSGKASPPPGGEGEASRNAGVSGHGA